jgi:hypothetical protein
MMKMTTTTSATAGEAGDYLHDIAHAVGPEGFHEPENRRLNKWSDGHDDVY